MKNGISRRQFGQLLGAGAALGAMAGLPSLASAATRLRLIWWGNPDRDKRTNEVVDLYSEDERRRRPSTARPMPGTTTGRSSPRRPPGRTCPTSSRWTTATSSNMRAAASSPISRPSSARQIDLADFDPNQLESGKVDGKLYGISMGANSMTHVYKPAMLEQLGLTLPDPTKWTIDDFVAMGKEVKGKLPEGVYFSREHGLSTSRGSRPGCASAARRSTPPTASSATTSRTSTEYFAFWFQMQEDGLTPPADLQAQAIASGKMEETMFVTGHAVFDFIHSNQLVADAEAGDRTSSTSR